MDTKQALLCKKFEGVFFTHTICESEKIIKTKTTKKIAVDYQIALLIKKNIKFEIIKGRLYDFELVYIINNTTIRNLFNI